MRIGYFAGLRRAAIVAAAAIACAANGYAQTKAAALPDWSGIWQMVGPTVFDGSTVEPKGGRAGDAGVRERPPYNAEWEGRYQRNIQAIKDGGLLEYYPLEDNRFELGGFTNLKAWLERAKVGFTAEAKALNLTPPRGIMLVGVPGCGKSLAAKAIAREWQLPLLKLDAGRLLDRKSTRLNSSHRT